MEDILSVFALINTSKIAKARNNDFSSKVLDAVFFIKEMKPIKDISK
jgi:hypothetical protein